MKHLLSAVVLMSCAVTAIAAAPAVETTDTGIQITTLKAGTGAAPVVAGVINVHGELRPVIDLRRLLGIETVAKGSDSRVILLRKDGREMGLQIDSVEQIRSVGSADAQTGVDGQGASAQVSPHVKGSTKDLLMLLSTEALFAELAIGATT